MTGADKIAYIDEDIVLNEILRLKVACWNDTDIMQHLNMSVATYYKYRAKAYAAVADQVKQQKHDLVEATIQMSKSRLESGYKKLQDIIDNPATKDKDRIDAIKEQHTISIDLAKLDVELPKLLAARAVPLQSLGSSGDQP